MIIDNNNNKKMIILELHKLTSENSLLEVLGTSFERMTEEKQK